MVAQRAPQDHEQHQHACAEVVLSSLGLRQSDQTDTKLLFVAALPLGSWVAHKPPPRPHAHTNKTLGQLTWPQCQKTRALEASSMQAGPLANAQSL